MCSFLFTRTIRELGDDLIHQSNRLARHRGPDHTGLHRRMDGNGYYLAFVHNLLDISGESVHQPRIESDSADTKVLLFNGEIYNFRSLSAAESDTDCVLKAYSRFGAELPCHLDGEFSMVVYDAKASLISLFTDPFLTKPLYYSHNRESGELGVATCASSLEVLGFKEPSMAAPDSRIAFHLGSSQVLPEISHPLRGFSIRQHKTSYEDWIFAFEKAVRQRAEHGARPVSVYLSSGYDSGGICAALNRMGLPYETFTILAGENRNLVEERIRINKRASCTHAHLIERVSKEEAERISDDIAREVEPFSYQHEDGPGLIGSVQTDGGAVGAHRIAAVARSLGQVVNLSGSGADEIMSDYGFGGVPFYHHSEFGGKFPEEMEGFFPWRKFYGDSQRSYLFKDEFILGRHGVEGRYPYLDHAVVQEFLWLSAELKNRAYKAPLAAFLDREAYPYEAAVKRGFLPVGVEESNNAPPVTTGMRRFFRKLSRPW